MIFYSDYDSDIKDRISTVDDNTVNNAFTNVTANNDTKHNIVNTVVTSDHSYR